MIFVYYFSCAPLFSFLNSTFSKLLNIPIQRKVIDTLPILCADKNYQGINDVLCNGIDLVEADFTLTYPDANLCLNTYDVEITTINPTTALLADGTRAQIITLEQQTHALNTNLQK